MVVASNESSRMGVHVLVCLSSNFNKIKYSTNLIFYALVFFMVILSKRAYLVILDCIFIKSNSCYPPNCSACVNASSARRFSASFWLYISTCVATAKEHTSVMPDALVA